VSSEDPFRSQTSTRITSRRRRNPTKLAVSQVRPCDARYRCKASADHTTGRGPPGSHLRPVIRPRLSLPPLAMCRGNSRTKARATRLTAQPDSARCTGMTCTAQHPGQ
jgi:hypothetical protein